MPSFNPHSLQQVDYTTEMEICGAGRLVKARFPDQPAPNVSWIWIQLGNCMACKYYGETPPHPMPICLNSKITQVQFRREYQQQCNCPGFEAGQDPKTAAADDYTDKIDVMKAIGLVPGKSSQRVEVIVNAPWSISLAERAHQESSYFLELAQYADYLRNNPKASNDPSRGEYVDLSDDLEPKSAAAQTP